MKKGGLFFAFMSLLFLAACGSSDSTSTATTAAADDVQGASGANTALGSAINGTNSGASSSESVTQALRAVMKGKMKTATKAATTEVALDDEEISIDCTNGGSITSVANGTATVDTTTGAVTLDLTSTLTFDECSESPSLALDDGSMCDYTAIMDGNGTCTMEGTGGESSFELTVNCSTSASCSGITLSINGTEHTLGFSMSGSMTADDDEPSLSGDICIDGTSFDMEDVQEEVLSATEATCS